MKSYKKITFALIFIIPLFLNLFVFSTNALSERQIEYNFNNEIFLDLNDVEFDISNNYNVKNVEYFTNTYNATYSFTNDTDYSNPTNWIIDETGGSVNVLPTLDNHDKVLELNDTNNSEICNAYQFFISNITFGTIEYFVRINDADKKNGFLIRDYDNLTLCGINIENDVFKYLTNIGTWSTTGLTILDNTWYHISFDFECTSGNYKGLTQYYYQFRINGQKYGQYEFYLYQSNAENIRIYTAENDVNYTVYYDAIGYSWNDFYDIADNSIPLSTFDSTIIEIDRMLFDYDADFSFYNDYDENIYQMTTSTSGSTNKVYSLFDSTINKRVIELYTDMFGGSQLIEVDYTSTTANHIRFDFNFTFKDLGTEADTHTEIIVKNDNSDDSVWLVFESENDTHNILNYWNGVAFIPLMPISINTYYYFNIYINHITDFCTIYYEINNIPSGMFLFSILDPTKNGLKQIRFIVNHHATDTPEILQILDIGVYLNGTSLSNDYGLIFTPIETNEWNNKHYNLISFTSEKTFESKFYISNFYFNDTAFISHIILNNSIHFENIYFNNEMSVSNPFYFVFSITNQILVDSILFDVYIRGNSISDNTETYWLSYESNSVDNNISYFYVDLRNRLQFNLNTNDNNTEYIQATIDINNVNSTNRFLSFRSNLFGSNIGTFRLEFITFSNVFLLEKLDMSYFKLISQGQIINKIVLLITDNDLTYEGNTIGYFSIIKLRYTEIETTIITLTIISLIIPLIIILLPSITISNIYSKALLVPLFILFTVITSISGLIPYWLLFIILYNTIIFMYLKQKEFSESFE